MLRRIIITLYIALFVVGGVFYIFTHSSSAQISVEEREAQLRAELDQVLKEIAEQQEVLKKEQATGDSFQKEVNILTGQINEAKLKIRAKNLSIETLGKDITVKTDTINQLTGKIGQTRDSLAQLIRTTNELDSYTLTDVALSNKSLSDFFVDVDALGSIKESIQVALGHIKQSKSDTENARHELDKKRAAEINAKISIEVETAKIQKKEKEKAALLSLSKEQQRSYQSGITAKQTRAASIRAALFSLRDSAAIPFGQAFDFATAASAKTGVRPAFLLAILTQESNLGQNVGSCYVTNLVNGDGIRVTTGAVVSGIMKPTRDIQPFIRITKGVGREPTETRVSCPFSTGYGGAMGPSQFIPSTWELFQTRIAAALGKPAADPWNPQDAIMASAIYLGDLGAGRGDYASERNAACRYYSGRACDAATPSNAFYGNEVMAKATNIQTNMIDPLSGN